MARITDQWLRGLDLEMVLAWDLSSVAQWLSSISAHENRIKKVYPTFFFLFFWNFEIQNSKFEFLFFYFLLVNASFLFFFFFFFFF